MKKYKDMTYTIRNDGRLMKKITVAGKSKYLYDEKPEMLYKQYMDYKYLTYNGIILDENINVKSLSLKWQELNSSGKEYNTIRENKLLIDNHIIPLLGYIKIKDLKKNNIREMLKNLEHTPTTAAKALALIKRILNDAVDNDIVLKNVAQNIKPPKIIKKPKKILSKFEDDKLLNSDNKHALFFIFMRYFGLRREETVPLLKEDIDIKNKTLNINKAVYFVKGKPFLKTTKTDSSRKVPIPDIILDKVKDFYENIPNGLLFVKKDGEMLTESAIDRHLESVLYDMNREIISKNKKIENEDEKEKLIAFTCYTLRHSYCTMLYYAGVKIKKAQELMGHRSSRMVLEVYTHLDEERENAVDLINSYLS